MADWRNSITTTLCTDVYYILRRNDDTAVIASLRGQTVRRRLRSECFAYWQNNIAFKHYSSYATHVLAKCINKKINCSDFSMLFVTGMLLTCLHMFVRCFCSLLLYASSLSLSLMSVHSIHALTLFLFITVFVFFPFIRVLDRIIESRIKGRSNTIIYCFEIIVYSFL